MKLRKSNNEFLMRKSKLKLCKKRRPKRRQREKNLNRKRRKLKNNARKAWLWTLSKSRL